MDLLIVSLGVASFIAVTIGVLYVSESFLTWLDSPTEQPEIPVEIQEQMRAKVVNGLLILGGNMYKISEIELIERKTGLGFGTRSLLRFTSGAELILLHAYHPSLLSYYFMPEDEIMQFMIKG
jgi:hypothetical protein